MRALVIVLLLALVAATGLCVHLWCDVDRLSDQVMAEAYSAGWHQGTVDVLNVEKRELTAMLRLAYLKGFAEGGVCK